MSGDDSEIRYRPRKEAVLQVLNERSWVNVSLETDTLELPVSPERTGGIVAARIQRVSGGYRVVPIPGQEVHVNGRIIDGMHMLSGGDEIRVANFRAVFTASRKELPHPMVLLVRGSRGSAIEVRTHREQIDVGAGEDCDLIIDDDTVNQLHCVIRRNQSGAMRIEDKGSRNGVYVGRTLIDREMALRDGAVVTIGRAQLAAWSRVEDRPGSFDWGQTADEPLAPLGSDSNDTVRGGGFDYENPTRLEDLGHRVDVRPSPRDYDGYDYAEDTPDSGQTLDRNRPTPRSRRADDDGSSGDETRAGFDATRRGLTLVHKPEKNRKPRK